MKLKEGEEHLTVVQGEARNDGRDCGGRRRGCGYRTARREEGRGTARAGEARGRRIGLGGCLGGYWPAAVVAAIYCCRRPSE